MDPPGEVAAHLDKLEERSLEENRMVVAGKCWVEACLKEDGRVDDEDDRILEVLETENCYELSVPWALPPPPPPPAINGVFTSVLFNIGFFSTGSSGC